MKIRPAILGKYLHDAAVEQLSSDLRSEGYDVQHKARIGGSQASIHADLIARRGDETIVYEVKVLGDRSHANLAGPAQAAHDIGAQFRMVVVRPQRQIGIEVEGVSELVLKALREVEPNPLSQVSDALGNGWHVVRVTDVELDAVAWRGDDVQVSGAAVAGLDNPDQGDLLLALPLTFTLWLNAALQFTRPPSITADTSDLDV